MQASSRRCGGPALVVLVTALVATTTHAQSASQRQAAAEAYDRGTSAWLAEQYERAARFFETAHRLAPNAAALLQAVRSHERAGHHLRAATLSLRLKALYPENDRGVQIADKILDDADGLYVLVNVSCDGCSIDLNGTLQDHPSFFVDAGVEHVVLAAFAEGEVSRSVQGEPGDVLDLEIAPPEPSEPDPGAATDTLEPTGASEAAAAPRDGPRGLPMWVTVSALSATAVMGSVTLWSGVDTLKGVDEFEETGSRDLYERGQDKERRTNILIGATLGMAAVTGLLAIFTDWKGEKREAPVEGAVALHPEGGVATLRGRF